MIFKNRFPLKNQKPVFETVQHLSISSIGQKISVGLQGQQLLNFLHTIGQWKASLAVKRKSEINLLIDQKNPFHFQITNYPPSSGHLDLIECQS